MTSCTAAVYTSSQQQQQAVVAEIPPVVEVEGQTGAGCADYTASMIFPSSPCFLFPQLFFDAIPKKENRTTIKNYLVLRSIPKDAMEQNQVNLSARVRLTRAKPFIFTSGVYV